MKRVAVLLAGAILAGCTVGPNYQRPPLTTPDQFYGASGPLSAASIADQPWWEIFRDATLRSLIDEALRNGYDTRIAAARVEEARARYGIAGADYYPSLGYQAAVERGHTSTFATPSDVTGSLIVANVSLAWEADLWGRIRRLNEAARAQYLATEEGRRGVILSLVAEVASAYFDLRELDQELEIARRTRASFQDTYDLFERRLKGGTASALETSRAEASLAAEAAQVPLVEQRIVAKENQLNLLLGRLPGPIPRGAPLADQPTPPSIPAGLPASLLVKRPDVREAEQQLIAANANIGVAQAAFYPTLSLTGLLGGQSPELSSLLNSGRMWSIEVGLLGPIFEGGRLRAQKRVALAQFEQARLAYERGVTNALGEVSTTLVALQKLGEEEAQRARAVAADHEAVRLATLRYESGLSAYFEVLDAMEQLLTAENSLAQTRRDRLVALAQFYKALGGGWQGSDAATGAGVPAATR
jgi:multidrug efflux system outer membrane protein